MKKYILYKKRNKWIVQHLYAPAVYKKEFRFKFVAIIKKYFLELVNI